MRTPAWEELVAILTLSVLIAMLLASTLYLFMWLTRSEASVPDSLGLMKTSFEPTAISCLKDC